MAGAHERALEAMGAVAASLGLTPGGSAGAPVYIGAFERWPLRIEDDAERGEVNVWLTVPSPPALPDALAATGLRSVLGRLDPTTGAGLVLQADHGLYDRAVALGAALTTGTGVLSI